MGIVDYENLPSRNTPLTGGVGGNLRVMQEQGTTYGTSTKLGYAQSFLNEHIINVSNEVDEDYRVNFLMPSKFDTSQTPVAYYNATSSVINNGIRITITAANTNLWCAYKLSNNLLGKQIYLSSIITPNASNTGRIAIFYGTDAEPYKQGAKIVLNQSGNISGSLLSSLPSGCTGIYVLIYGNGSSSNVQVGNYVDYTNLRISSTIPAVYVDNEEIYSKPVVLWQNSSPTSDFASQTITLNDSLANYSFYEVIYKTSKDENIGLNSGKIPTSMGTTLFGGFNGTDGGVRNRNRPIVIASNTTMNIGNTNTINTSNNTYTATENGRLIPYQILGYK